MFSKLYLEARQKEAREGLDLPLSNEQDPEDT